MRNFLYSLLDIVSPLFRIWNRKNLIVLAYHDIIDEENFEEQLKYLKENYNLLNVKDLFSHLYKKKALPHYSLLITFDDGDISVLEKGLPILEKYDVPACLFIISELVNTSKDYWTNMVRINEREKGRNRGQIQQVVQELKSLDNKERLKRIKKYRNTEKIQLTDEQLRELQKRKMTIANHSHTHPMFNRCTEQEILNEIKCFKRLSALWEVGCFNIFAYPNGNYDLTSENILRNGGVEMAFLFDHKVNVGEIDPMRISRIRVDSDTSLAEFKVKTSGFHSLILSAKSWLRG